MTIRHLVALVLLLLCAPAGVCEQDAILSGTKPLTGQDDLSAAMLDGMHRFIDRKMADSINQRPEYWHRDLSSSKAYERSVQANRDRFKKIIGVADTRLPAVMERFGDEHKPALVGETDRFSAYQVRWPVLEGITGEGLWLQPKGKPVGLVIALGDADQDPEMIVGLSPGVPAESQFARRLAESGFAVVVPVLISRSAHASGNPRIRMTNLPHREWIYRSAYLMGRHVIGYEVQKVLSVVDWFKRTAGADAKVGIAGYGEGGLLALYSAAVDTRIDACLVSGYFDSREQRSEEPVYRNVWGLLREFGDAEIATLVAPRGLVVEYSAEPRVEGPQEPPAGQRSAAAPGRLRTPKFRVVSAEFNRIDGLTRPDFQPKRLVRGLNDAPVGPGSAKALQEFLQLLGYRSTVPASGKQPEDRRKSFDARARQDRQVREMQDQLQRMIERSDEVRTSLHAQNHA